jgi:hypothetical protein
VLGEKFGFTPERVVTRALEMIKHFPEKAAQQVKVLSGGAK